MRIINFGISVLAFVCFTLAPAVSGASTATISFPLPTSIKIGEKVTAPLKVNVSNGDLGGLLVDIIYDPTALTILADSDIVGANGNYMCTANTHYAVSSLKTSRMSCVTGYTGFTGTLTLANVTITGVGYKQGQTLISIVPRAFISSINSQSALPQPTAFSSLPSTINKMIYVKR
jgi:hypothetical protein